jgi:hypothetical protein
MRDMSSDLRSLSVRLQDGGLSNEKIVRFSYEHSLSDAATEALYELCADIADEAVEEVQKTLGGARKEPLATRERTTPSTPAGEPKEVGTNFDEVLKQVEGWSLLDALVHVAIWENDRTVKQALRGERNPHTLQLWETCFRHAFETVLTRRSLKDGI